RARMAETRTRGGRVAAYGAAAKGAIMLNWCGLKQDDVEYVVDRNPHKHGHWMPGTSIPIRGEAALRESPPDLLLLLAWNYAREIAREQHAYLEVGGRFLMPCPEPRVVSRQELERWRA
ncbi:MAG: methyltransferase, partial [Planctomycetota bacterium]